jgi:hypothetical protein
MLPGGLTSPRLMQFAKPFMKTTESGDASLDAVSPLPLVDAWMHEVAARRNTPPVGAGLIVAGYLAIPLMTRSRLAASSERHGSGAMADARPNQTAASSRLPDFSSICAKVDR